jgi:hypothetical protein
LKPGEAYRQQKENGVNWMNWERLVLFDLITKKEATHKRSGALFIEARVVLVNLVMSATRALTCRKHNDEFRALNDFRTIYTQKNFAILS